MVGIYASVMMQILAWSQQWMHRPCLQSSRMQHLPRALLFVNVGASLSCTFTPSRRPDRSSESRSHREVPSILTIPHMAGRATTQDTVHTAFLADIEETARRHDPWLFSKACEDVMESLASLSDPTPLDVMNWTMLLTAPPKRTKSDPDGPGDSIGMRLILPSYCPIRWEHPHRLLDAPRGFSLWDLPDR